jgi:hypothetical protein
MLILGHNKRHRKGYIEDRMRLWGAKKGGAESGKVKSKCCTVAYQGGMTWMYRRKNAFMGKGDDNRKGPNS